jgi:hypothetical protein
MSSKNSTIHGAPRPSAIRPQSLVLGGFAALAFLAFASVSWGQLDISTTDSFVTTSWDGWNGTPPTGFTQNRTYRGTTATTTGGTYAIANNGLGWQATSGENSLSVVGTFRNNTGFTQTSVTIEYDAFQIVNRTSRTPGWTVSSSLGTVSDLDWAFDSSKSAESPAIQTVTLTGLSIANAATFTVTWASDRGAGSGSSPLIGLRNVKVRFNAAAASPPVVTASTFAGTVGTAFSESISATNSPTSYGLQSGSLPAGLSLNTSTGAITGTPTTAATGSTVTINATNASGTGNATITFNIAKGDQTITFPAQSSLGIGATRTLDATTPSGLAITYTSSNTGVATISGTDVTGVAAGTTTLTASQAGDANWNPATPVDQSLTVAAVPILRG